MALEFKTPPGTKDVLHAEIERWHYPESSLKNMSSGEQEGTQANDTRQAILERLDTNPQDS